MLSRNTRLWITGACFGLLAAGASLAGCGGDDDPAPSNTTPTGQGGSAAGSGQGGQAQAGMGQGGQGRYLVLGRAEHLGNQAVAVGGRQRAEGQ